MAQLLGSSAQVVSATCVLPARILIADDQPDLVDALRLLLKPEGMHVDAVHSPDAALAAVQRTRFDLVLMDLNYTGDTTSGREGIDLLSRLQAIDGTLPVVVMTGWGSIDLAVEAMRRGVRDFVQKPWDNAALVALLRSEIAAGRERRAQRPAGGARAGRGPPHPADAAARRRCRRWTASSWRHRGSRPPASAATATTPSASRRSRLALSIADVVGKGIPAALLMSNLQAAVRAFATEAARPAELCEQVNTVLCGHIAEGRFISFFYCVADSEVGMLSYTNAGHFPPVVVRADGSVEQLTAGGAVLGVFPDGVYEAATVAFGAGRSAGALYRRHHRGPERRRRGVRRGPADVAGRRAPRLQRARAAGAAGGRRRLFHRPAVHRRRHADGAGGRQLAKSPEWDRPPLSWGRTA